MTEEIIIAGFGGQGVLSMGKILAYSGVMQNQEVSWMPSYGPEMRSGTSNCQVRLASHMIDSPLVSRSHVLVAMNEPSLRKFYDSVRPGGWIIYNGETIPEEFKRIDVHVLAREFTAIANELGDARAGNMIMLGSLLEITSALPEACVGAALRRLLKNPRWIDLDERAIARGRELYRESVAVMAI